MDIYRIHCYIQKGRRREIKLEQNIFANSSEEATKLLISILEKYFLKSSYISVMCLTLGYSDEKKKNLNLPSNPKIDNEFYLIEKLRKYCK